MDAQDEKNGRKCFNGFEKCRFSEPMREWSVEGGRGKARKKNKRGRKPIVRRQNTERREEGKAEERWEGAGEGREKLRVEG